MDGALALTPPRGVAAVTGRKWLPRAVLAIGVLVVASASILIRYAMQDGAGPLAIAALRLAIASVVLAPFAWGRVRNDLPRLSGIDRTLLIACGVVLALHFATWISSLAYTSVASSAVLVTTNPVWVGLLSWLVLRERPGNVMIGGIALAMAGSVLVFGAQGPASGAAPSPLLGNALALAGALAASIYLLLGRRLRDRLSLLAYVWTVYAVAAVALLAMALAAGENLALPMAAVGFVTALALGPQLIGHTAFNYAVRHLPAPVVAVAILGEPLGSALLAWLLFDEKVGTGQLVGFGVLLAGILLSVLADARPAVPSTAADK